MIAAIYALILTLVALPAVAAAECAWVLWVYTLSRPVEVYQVQSAHESKRECETESIGFSGPLKSTGYEVMAGRGEVLARKGDEHKRYFCLPDTIDPRGPKGGGR